MLDPSSKDEVLAPLRQFLERLDQLARTADPPTAAAATVVHRDASRLATRVQRLLEDPIPETPRPPLLPPPGLPEKDAGRFTVLVVEDEDTTREGICQLLEPWFEVISAANASEAALVIRECRPDVVLTDLHMPMANGLALGSTLRECDETVDVPFLVVSGRGDPETQVMAFEEGAFDFLTKPVSSRELVARIRNALVRSQALRRERTLQLTDELTGLANRRALKRFLSVALRDGRAAAGLCVVMVDMDGLKRLNDTHGHAAGDAGLKAIARALNACKRTGDLAARVGGDEFVVALPGAKQAGGENYVSRVKEQLSREVVEVDQGVLARVSASFGVATLEESDGAGSVEGLLELADRALYQHKRQRTG